MANRIDLNIYQCQWFVWRHNTNGCRIVGCFASLSLLRFTGKPKCNTYLILYLVYVYLINSYHSGHSLEFVKHLEEVKRKCERKYIFLKFVLKTWPKTIFCRRHFISKVALLLILFLFTSVVLLEMELELNNSLFKLKCINYQITVDKWWQIVLWTYSRPFCQWTFLLIS